MISANGGLPAHRYTPQVTQRWPRGSEPASTYLDAKYVKKRTSWRTLQMNNPLGLWSWDPLASSYDYGGQNLIHSAYEAR